MVTLCVEVGEVAVVKVTKSRRGRAMDGRACERCRVDFMTDKVGVGAKPRYGSPQLSFVVVMVYRVTKENPLAAAVIHYNHATPYKSQEIPLRPTLIDTSTAVDLAIKGFWKPSNRFLGRLCHPYNYVSAIRNV